MAEERNLVAVSSTLITNAEVSKEGLWEVLATIRQERSFEDGYKEAAEQSVKVIDSDIQEAIGKALLTIIGISESGLNFKEVKE